MALPVAQPEGDVRLPPLAWLTLAAAALVLAIVHVRVSVLAPDAARFSFDSAEYALAGRTWLETGKLATPFVHPAAAAISPGPPYPLVAGHPLVPALDAVAFFVVGRTTFATLFPAVLAYVVAVLCTAWLALGLSGSRLMAIGAGAAFAVSPWALRFASEGLSEMPFAALLTAALALLWEMPVRPKPLLLGVVLGLAHLTRPVVVPILPAVILGIVWLSPEGRTLRTLLLFAATFLPIAALTALYKWAATGSALTDVG